MIELFNIKFDKSFIAINNKKDLFYRNFYNYY